MDGWWKLAFRRVDMPFFNGKKHETKLMTCCKMCGKMYKITKVEFSCDLLWARTRSRFQSRPHTKLLPFQGDMKQTILKWNMVENGRSANLLAVAQCWNFLCGFKSKKGGVFVRKKRLIFPWPNLLWIQVLAGLWLYRSKWATRSLLPSQLFA